MKAIDHRYFHSYIFIFIRVIYLHYKKEIRFYVSLKIVFARSIRTAHSSFLSCNIFGARVRFIDGPISEGCRVSNWSPYCRWTSLHQGGYLPKAWVVIQISLSLLVSVSFTSVTSFSFASTNLIILALSILLSHFLRLVPPLHQISFSISLILFPSYHLLNDLVGQILVIRVGAFAKNFIFMCGFVQEFIPSHAVR